MLTNILDKYTKVFESTNARYKNYGTFSFTENKILLAKLESLSGNAKAMAYRLSLDLEYNDYINYDKFYENLIIAANGSPGDKSYYRMINELLSIDFLIKISNGVYCINFAYSHRFSNSQYNQLRLRASQWANDLSRSNVGRNL